MRNISLQTVRVRVCVGARCLVRRRGVWFILRIRHDVWGGMKSDLCSCETRLWTICIIYRHITSIFAISKLEIFLKIKNNLRDLQFNHRFLLSPLRICLTPRSPFCFLYCLSGAFVLNFLPNKIYWHEYTCSLCECLFIFFGKFMFRYYQNLLRFRFIVSPNWAFVFRSK